MLWLKSLHIIFIVTWFSGLFYLPRLFVYHAQAEDAIGIKRFKIMERKLYYGITWPSAVLATFFGIWLLFLDWQTYLQSSWMYGKLILVILLWVYHLQCGFYYKCFKQDQNHHSHIFFRWFNEVPVILLALIVFLAVINPSLW